MQEFTRPTDIRVLSGRRVLDTAEGVLIGLRRCGPDAAFAELVDVSRRRSVPVFALASALIELARGVERPVQAPQPAWSSAQREWGWLLADSQDG